MDKQRFEHILAAHGSRPERWPDADRTAAVQFCAADPQAAAMLREARALDSLISALPDIEPSPELSARITAAALTQNPPFHIDARRAGGRTIRAGDHLRRLRRLREGLWPFGPLWRPAAGLALPALFGLLLGLYQPQQILSPGSGSGSGASPGTGSATITLTNAAASDGDPVQVPTYDLTELAFASLDPLESFVMSDAGFPPAAATQPQMRHIMQQPVQHNATNATVDAAVATANDTVGNRTTKRPEPQRRSATLPADPAAGPAPATPAPSPDRAISPPATPALPTLPQPAHRGTPGSALGFSPSPSGGQGGWR